MNDNPTDAKSEIRTMLEDTLVHTLDLRLAEDIPMLAENLAKWHQQALEAAELRAHIKELEQTLATKGIIYMRGMAVANIDPGMLKARLTNLRAELKEMEQVKS